MALKVQYNKTFLTYLKKQLAIRKKVLPTLKSKETALRLEVKKISEKLKSLRQEKEDFLNTLEEDLALWTRYPEVLKVESIDIRIKNTAGTKIPVLEDIQFKLGQFIDFDQPVWLLKGLDVLKKIVLMETREQVYQQQHDILHQARKKTTQKVNLYEKVQIPAFELGINQIKRFLEDKENIAKAAQKIVKERNQKKEVEQRREAA